AIAAGAPASLTFTLVNAGAVAAEGVTAGLRVVDPATLAVVASDDLPAGAIPPGGSFTATRAVPTAGLRLGVYAASLVALREGGGVEVLATARFRVADGRPPTLSVSNLAPGACVGPLVAPQVRAQDDASGVAGVRASVDGLPAVPLALAGGNALDGVWSALLVPGADGVHTLAFVAGDAEGNDGALAPAGTNPLAFAVIVDSAPPE